MKLLPEDVDRALSVTKSIEYDVAEAFHTCCQRFGKEVTATALVMYLRLQMNPGRIFPTPDDVPTKIHDFLKQAGIEFDVPST